MALPAPRCEIRWAAKGGSRVQLRITNTGRTRLNGWTLAWSFTGDQKVTSATEARVRQSAANVTLTGRQTIKPDKSQTVDLRIDGGSLANWSPELFRIGGATCG